MQGAAGGAAAGGGAGAGGGAAADGGAAAGGGAGAGGPAAAEVDVVVIGAGPAGLSAALNLVRSRRTVLILDANRPRHSATLRSHGFLTRDGISPLELRRLGREEVLSYEGAELAQAEVTRVQREGRLLRVQARGVRGGADREVRARAVLIAAGLSERLPALPSIRAYYGTALHSCIACDAFEDTGEPLALIGETKDVFDRALLLASFTADLIVFTNGADVVSAEEEAFLAGRGISVERTPIVDVVGDKAVMTGIALSDGRVIARSAGFLRPTWSANIGYAEGLGLERDAWGLLDVDELGRTNVPGVWAAGDITPPGPQQLVVAAGEGARVANAVVRSLVFEGTPGPHGLSEAVFTR